MPRSWKIQPTKRRRARRPRQTEPELPEPVPVPEPAYANWEDPAPDFWPDPTYIDEEVSS
jgi:hypothetical protein